MCVQYEHIYININVKRKKKKKKYLGGGNCIVQFGNEICAHYRLSILLSKPSPGCLLCVCVSSPAGF